MSLTHTSSLGYLRQAQALPHAPPSPCPTCLHHCPPHNQGAYLVGLLTVFKFPNKVFGGSVGTLWGSLGGPVRSAGCSTQPLGASLWRKEELVPGASASGLMGPAHTQAVGPPLCACRFRAPSPPTPPTPPPPTPPPPPPAPAQPPSLPPLLPPLPPLNTPCMWWLTVAALFFGPCPCRCSATAGPHVLWHQYTARVATTWEEETCMTRTAFPDPRWLLPSLALGPRGPSLWCGTRPV